LMVMISSMLFVYFFNVFSSNHIQFKIESTVDFLHL
jgi:hypothetical protein